MLYGTIFNISEIVYRYHARNPVDERGAQTIAIRTLFFFKGGFFFYFLWLRTINMYGKRLNTCLEKSFEKNRYGV